MSAKILKTESDYQKALNRLEEIFDVKANTPEGDEAELLVLLIEKYEEEHYPILPPDPIEAIRFRMGATRSSEERPGRNSGLQEQGH